MLHVVVVLREVQRDHLRGHEGASKETSAPEGPNEVRPPVGLPHLPGDTHVSVHGEVSGVSSSDQAKILQEVEDKHQVRSKFTSSQREMRPSLSVIVMLTRREDQAFI